MAWLYLFLFLLALFLWILRQSCSDKSRRPDTRIPGPTPAFLSGNITLLKHPNISMLFQELRDKYGPIYKLKILSEHWVVVSDYAMLRELFVTKGMTFAGRSSCFPMNFLAKDLSIIFSMDLDKQVQQLRYILTRTMKRFAQGSSSLEKSAHYKSEALAHFINNLAKKNGDVHDVTDDIKQMTGMMISELLFGDAGYIEHEQLAHISDLFVETFTSKDKFLLDMFPLLKSFNMPSWKKYKKLHHLIDNMYNKYKRKIGSPIENTEDDTLMHFLTETTQHKSGLNSGHSADKLVRGLMTSIILAGIPSTTVFIYRTLLTIAYIPRIQRKVQEELHKVVGDRAPRVSDRENCHYIQATIMEVLRNLFTSITEAPRKALKDTTLGRYDIPAGTILLPNTWAIHHDPEFWDEPYEYKPERFLDDQGSLLPADHPTRQRFMPFHAGARVCPGEAFAKARLFITISSLFKMFTVKPEDEADLSVLDPKITGPLPKIKLRFIENI